LVVSNEVGRLTPLAAPTGTEPAKLGIIRHVLKVYPMPESMINKTTGFMATNLQSYHSLHTHRAEATVIFDLSPTRVLDLSFRIKIVA
ncbi:hypothetical protein, partial [Cylindrospermopsis raciborskii]|uniref:hypothetical protein n=1 Tax=Cylindrospermopsis raciborskii TaxID=77022 RepID=UPI001F446A1B